MRGHSFVLPATLGSSSLKRNQISFPQLVGTSGPHLSRCQCYYKVSGNLHWGHPWASATFFWAQMPGSQTCFRANLKRREAPGAWGPQPLCFSISFGDPQTKEETPPPLSDLFQKATQLWQLHLSKDWLYFSKTEAQSSLTYSHPGPPL